MKLLQEVIKNVHATTLSPVCLTTCASLRMIELEAAKYLNQPSGLAQTMDFSLVEGGGLQGKIKPSILDGHCKISPSNIRECLNVWMYTIAVSTLAIKQHLEPYVNMVNSLLDNYPSDWELLFGLHRTIQEEIFSKQNVDQSVGKLFLEYAKETHPFWELEFFSKARKASQARHESEVARQMQGISMARNDLARAGLSGGQKDLATPTKGLINQADSPHGGNGCPELHISGKCTKDPCPKSHTCPLIRCNGVQHSFSKHHRVPGGEFLSWKGRPTTKEESESQSKKRPAGVTLPPPPNKFAKKGGGRGKGR